MYLEESIGKQVFEDLTHEFKARLDRTDIVRWLQTLAGFANNFGGELFIGVEDKTSKLIGFDRKGADNERNFFNNMVNQLPTGQSPRVCDCPTVQTDSDGLPPLIPAVSHSTLAEGHTGDVTSWGG